MLSRDFLPLFAHGHISEITVASQENPAQKFEDQTAEDYESEDTYSHQLSASSLLYLPTFLPIPSATIIFPVPLPGTLMPIPSRPESTSPPASLSSARFTSVQVKYCKGRSVLTQPKRTNRALKLLFLLDFATWLAPFGIERLLELRVGFALLGGLCLF